MEIRVDDLQGLEIISLLQEHLDAMFAHSPAESCHALDLSGLRQPEVTLWSGWMGAGLAGCGALKELDPQHGEIKSMRTAQGYQKQGVASALLQHIIDEAGRRGYRRLSLETGSMPYFDPAIRLYTRFGFTRCGPFGEYVEDPFSIFMTKELESRPGPA